LPSGWRNGPAAWQTSVLTGPAGEHRVGYRVTRAGVAVDDLPGLMVLSSTAGTVVMEVDGVVRRWRVARYPGADGGCRHEVDGDAGAVTFFEAERFPPPSVADDPGSLRAPLPGTVVAVSVAVGDEVGAGQELLVIEAMKMRHTVRADRAGRVTALPVRAGSTVEVGAVLAVLDVAGVAGVPGGSPDEHPQEV
jgi:propionyl-CoA carboxylase alpha chain